MKQNCSNQGFTLLEVLIATAIASILCASLFVALSQTMRFQQAIDSYIDVSSRAALLQNQLEHDFMGFFVPWQAYDLMSSQTAQQLQKEKPMQIDKIFFATKNKEQFGELSFITTNAMQVYWGATMGAPKPFCARVKYRLVKDKEKENSFILQRQESGELDYAPFEATGEKQKVRAYDIVTDIKEMKVTYLARVYKNEDQKSPSPLSAQATTGNQEKNKKEETKKLPSWTYKQFTDWDWSPKKAKPKDAAKESSAAKAAPAVSKDQPSRVPFYMIVDLILWNVEHTRETSFRFVLARKPFEIAELETETPPSDKKIQQQSPVGPPGMPDFSKIFNLLNPESAATKTNNNPFALANNGKK